MEEKLDLLNRQPFITQLLDIAVAVSDKRKSACYAVDGEWGVGKSFVLDMIEEQAEKFGQEGEELPRFCVFRYNCWEYDYYEEPLVSFVAAMLDDIESKTDLFSPEVKERITKIFRAVGSGLLTIAAHVIEEKTGFDLLDAGKSGLSEAEHNNKEKQAYDDHLSFKKALNALRDEISEIAKHQTVVFLVDELDRCLPEYAIRTLERLHHLTEGVSNVQIILAVDRGQLEHTVKQIYGEKANAKRYLRKFVDFDLKLPVGTVQENFDQRFENYVKCFQKESTVVKNEEIDQLKFLLLEGIEMRQRIALIEKCSLLHNLMLSDEDMDPIFMVLELFLTLLSYTEPDLKEGKRQFDIRNVFSSEALHAGFPDKFVPEGLQELSKIYSNNDSPNGQPLFKQEDKRSYVNVSGLSGMLLYVYRNLLGFHDYISYPVYLIEKNNEWNIDLFLDYGERFWEMQKFVH